MRSANYTRPDMSLMDLAIEWGCALLLTLPIVGVVSAIMALTN